jgi:hypothetical protein
MARGSQTRVHAGAQPQNVVQAKPVLQPAVDGAVLSSLPPLVSRTLASSGEPLDSSTRAFFEPRFGYDFSQVRVHADERAAESARAVGALAYTVGRDVVFGVGQYRQGTSDGMRLLAHELAHVVQQNRSGIYPPTIDPQAPHERNADSVASSVIDGKSAVRVSEYTGVVLARQPRSAKTKAFQPTSGDKAYLVSLMRRLFENLDEKTRKTVLENKTIAIGLSLNDEGQIVYVYSVNGNWIDRNLKDVAEKQLQLFRLDASKEPGQRGPGGAPNDAEQIMIRGGDEFGFKIKAMAVSRKVCVDCVEALVQNEGGAIPVVEVLIKPTKPSMAIQGRMPRGSGSTGNTSGGGYNPSPKRIVASMTLNIVAGKVLGIFQSEFKDMVKRDLAKLPKPKIDKRNPFDFLKDSEMTSSIKGSTSLLNILNMDFKLLGQELEDKQLKLLVDMNHRLLAVAPASEETHEEIAKKIEYLDQIVDDLIDYEQQLLILRGNLDAVLEEEETAQICKKSADDSNNIIYYGRTPDGMLSDSLVRHAGLNPPEVDDIGDSLYRYSAAIANTFRDVHALSKKVNRLIENEERFAKDVIQIRHVEYDSQFNSFTPEDQAREEQVKAEKAAKAKREQEAEAAKMKREQKAENKRKQAKLDAARAQALNPPPTINQAQFLQPPDSTLPTVAGQASSIENLLGPLQKDPVWLGWDDTADLHEARKNELVRFAKKITQMQHENKLDLNELNRFISERDIWIKQLHRAIDNWKKSKTGNPAGSRLMALEDWIRNAGHKALYF